ncbi:MAG: 50S ribosomal protein L2 [Patescibacteria group bacterium]|nr:50S ribosomal protein L2 [Patescibacteria group bacterium]
MKKYKPTSPGRRHRVDIDKSKLSKKGPEKKLSSGVKEKAGRSGGKISVRHKGSRVKRKFRNIDFKRKKRSIPGEVVSLEYDPNRSAHIALIKYADGEKNYIIAPHGLEVGEKIVAGEDVEVKRGNAMPLANVPLGEEVHNVELHPGGGGQMVRSAGTSARVIAKPGKYVHLKMPSGEVRKVLSSCYATVGGVSNPDWENKNWGKAGRKRHLGIRPTVRGSAMAPDAHPHGGGEGRTGEGMPSPKTPWGKKTRGKKTRKRKHTDKYIVKDRREKK